MKTTIEVTLTAGGQTTDVLTLSDNERGRVELSPSHPGVVAVIEQQLDRKNFRVLQTVHGTSMTLAIAGPDEFRVRAIEVPDGEQLDVVLTGHVGEREMRRTIALPQAEYDALSPDPNIFYVIVNAA